MLLHVALSVLLAQASPSPSPTATPCPPALVKRVKLTNHPDPEWHGRTSECTGVSCFVVEVLVTVASDGSVTSATLKRSWHAETNDTALRDARSSTYIPATLNCRPVEGTYLFKEMFVTVN
jgi:hypothetical protein